MKNPKILILILVLGAIPMQLFAWDGMPTPPLHVEGRYLKDPSGKNVLLHGWMQPIETWFNGGGNRYSNPTDWTNPGNVAGMLNFLNEAATVMSDPSPKYGRDHGWYASFVRVNTDFIGGWTQQNGLVDQAQFNGWIQNFVVPYANHLKSRGLYLVLCATGPMMTPDNGAQNAGIVEQQRLRTFWSTVANAPGVKNADNIMFELMNEPVQIESSPGNGNWGSGSAPYFQAFRDWIQPIINDVRNTGANNVIWVPTLGWQGEPHGWAQYPFTGSNIGVAAHYYPAYGGVHDDPVAVQNLWNSNYKPAADLWPMMITECYWFPGGTGYDNLFNGTTAGFGNALKNAMDNQGNVSFLIGFLADHLVDLANSIPANCTLGSRPGTQAYFSWLPTYTWAAPTDGGGSGGVFNGVYSFVAQHSGKAIDTYNFGTGNGTNIVQWSYWGGDAQRYEVSHLGDGWHRISPVIATGQAIDVSGISSNNGANIHTWQYLGGHNQQWRFEEAGNGNWKLIARHSGKCLDVEGASTADGANILQWDCISGAPNQAFDVIPNGGARLAVDESLKENGDFKLYPNPSAGGVFTLDLSATGRTGYRLSIFNLEGKKVFESDELKSGAHRISSGLQKGMYFVKINGKNEKIQKLIIK